MSKEAMKLALEALRMPCNFWNKVQFIRVTEAIKALEEALAKQEQRSVSEHTGEPVGEMVAWPNDFERVGVDWISYVPDVGTKLYTTPQQRTWVGLNWGDLPEEWVGNLFFKQGARWAEAKLKEKNGA